MCQINEPSLCSCCLHVNTHYTCRIALIYRWVYSVNFRINKDRTEEIESIPCNRTLSLNWVNIYKWICFVQDLFRRLNLDAPLCIHIVHSFRNIGHLVECNKRHSFKPDERILNEVTQYRIKILHAFSPAWLTVRLIQSKNLNSPEWTDCNSAHLFDNFTAELNAFYLKSFKPIENTEDIIMDSMFVFRDGENFFRCKVIDNE